MRTKLTGNINSSYLIVEPLSNIEDIIEHYELLNKDVLMLGIEIKDWNYELSPWPMEAVFKNDDFKGGADKTIESLKEILKEYNDKTVIMAGYSLAGLFALYASYKLENIDMVASVSSSLWYKDFLEFVNNSSTYAEKIYFSLGDREEKTRHPVMKTVGDKTKAISKILSEKGVETFFEYNKGNHFVDHKERIIKAIDWLLK